jgi:hypothetical protein
MLPSSHDSMIHDHLKQQLRNLFSIALGSLFKSGNVGRLAHLSSEPIQKKRYRGYREEWQKLCGVACARLSWK